MRNRSPVHSTCTSGMITRTACVLFYIHCYVYSMAAVLILRSKKKTIVIFLIMNRTTYYPRSVVSRKFPSTSISDNLLFAVVTRRSRKVQTEIINLHFDPNYMRVRGLYRSRHFYKAGSARNTRVKPQGPS